MLEIQKYIKKRGFESAISRLSLRVNEHPNLPLHILNYDQIETSKSSKAAQECRCLVLERGTNELVAKSFTRFFNFGEAVHGVAEFDFSDFTCQEKLDGSLISVFQYKGERVICTKSTFGKGLLTETKTWEEVVGELLGDFMPLPGYNYVFELCSPYNQVVTYFSVPKLVLLTIFDGEREIGVKMEDRFETPKTHSLHSVEEMAQYFTTQSHEFEGFVLKDKYLNRLKIKSPKYLAAHRILNNGKPDILGLVLSNEWEEFVLGFPHYRPQCEKIIEAITKMRVQCEALWAKNKDKPSQKDFALGVKDSPLSSVLFSSRKTGMTVAKTLLEMRNVIENNLEKYV